MFRLLAISAAFMAAMIVSPAAAAPTTAELAAAAEAEVRGGEMFAYDQAAWHATDSFQEDIRRTQTDLQSLRDRGFQGYIVEPGEGGALVTSFYGKREGRTFAIARYIVLGSKVTSGGIVEPDGPIDLSLLANRMIVARDLATDAMQQPDHDRCTNSPFNTLVLPPKAGGLIPVYFLSSTAIAGMYPAGGHFRFDFDSDGKLTGERRFMKSCFNINYQEKDGNKAEALFLTHLLDPQPTEIHAFVSRNIPVQLMIATTSNRAIWSIGNGRIQYVQDIPGKD